MITAFNPAFAILLIHMSIYPWVTVWIKASGASINFVGIIWYLFNGGSHFSFALRPVFIHLLFKMNLAPV